jgi:hypothetical protein
MNDVTRTSKEPVLADYIARWSTVNVVAHEQERSAREDHATALIAWLRAEIERQANALKLQVELNAQQWKAGHDAALSAAHEPATGPVAPIACIRVGEDDTCEVVHLYAPGLPPGQHDLFPVPLNPNGEMQPHAALTPPPPAVLKQISDARLDWSMACECSCSGCTTFDDALRSALTKESEQS